MPADVSRCWQPGARSRVAIFPRTSAEARGRGASSSDWSSALAGWAQARLAAGGAPLLEDAMPEFERTLIREALKAAGGGRQDAAKLLGWGRNTLTRKLKELGMD